MIDQHTLYVDNFRGFCDEFIPLADVNFLVGENSTGKTSLISLLKLMSVGRFLIEGQFASEDIDLGTFQDIVSAHSNDKGYFRIGMIRRDVTAKGSMPMAMLVTYDEHEGLPRDICFTCTYRTKEISVRRVGKQFYFRSRDEAISENTNMRRLVSQWAAEHSAGGGDFNLLDLPLDPEAPLLLPVSAIALGLAPRSRASLPLLTPSVFPQLTWVAPIRAEPRRTYDSLRRAFSSEGIHTPYLVKSILDSEKEAQRFRTMMRKIGKGSGLFQSIDIKRYGEGATAPFEVHIVLDGKAINLTNVGYGVSQALPVLVEMIWRPRGSWLAVQQPEVHLHPRAQAAIGDLVFQMAKSQSKRFIIETHSDFMIDRFRTGLRNATGKKPASQLLYFERRDRRNTVTPLEISSNGDLPSKQPRSYRNFFLQETRKVLGL